MKPSRELRNLMLGFYHDLSGALPPDAISFADGVTSIGTGPDEFLVGGRAVRAAFLMQNEQLAGIKVTPGTIHAFEEGTVGWASDECTLELSNGRVLTLRMTVVFHREGSEWKAVHSHASHPADNLEHWGMEFDFSMDAIAEFIERDRPDLEPMTSPEGTLTIVFTDIESSTATNESLGDDSFLPVLMRHNEIVQTHTGTWGGSVVKSQGDGYMLAFSSARRAVECAIAVQRDVAGLDTPIKVRMGLHTGEPVRQADDFYGRDVAYAARVGAAASGGEILVSSLVKSLVEPSGSVRFDGPRELELKGFEGSQPLYEVLWR